MHNSIFATFVLYGLSVAAPRPREVNVEPASVVPDPTTFDRTSKENAAPLVSNNPVSSVAVLFGTSDVEAELKKRETCATLPGGAGTVPGDGSVNAYLDENNALRQSARSAYTPAGYELIFQDLTGSTEQIGYLTYKTIDDGSYDVQGCANFCNDEKFCVGFNIYYERDPSVDPTAACPNPRPSTNVKCSLYGYPVTEDSATNKGQFRGPADANGQAFQVVITGSNGYSRQSPSCRAPLTIPLFDAPVNLPAAIDAPLITKNGQQYDTYNGMRLFTTQPYDPSLCAAACQAQTTFDKNNLVDANGQYKPCNFFTSYILLKNGVPLGTYCALYTQAWGSSYATNTGYFSGGDAYRVDCVTSYTATMLDDGDVNV